MKNAFVVLVTAALLAGTASSQAGQPPTAPEKLLPPKEKARAEMLPRPEVSDEGAAPHGNGCGACGRESRSCREKFREWLFYQPLSRPGCCGCCLPRPQCCTPPLYAFFLCQPGATPLPSYQDTCGACSSCRKRRCHNTACSFSEPAGSTIPSAHDEPAKMAAPFSRLSSSEPPRTTAPSARVPGNEPPRTASSISTGLISWEEPGSQATPAAAGTLIWEQPVHHIR